MDNRHKAEAAAREWARLQQASRPDSLPEGDRLLIDLIAELDAARGDAVAWALTMPDGIRLVYVSEEASRRAEAKWPEAYEGCCHVPLYAAPQAPPAAVPAEGLTVKEAWWAGARAALGIEDDTPRAEVAAAFIRAAERAAPPAALAVPADNVTPMRQPRADLARLVESINATVYANADGLSVTEAIGALELAKLELLKEQEQ